MLKNKGLSYVLITVIFPISLIAAEIASSTKVIYAIGHLIPDTDSISAAIAAGYLFDAIPARTGEINAETKYVLDFFGVKEPKLVTDFSNSNVILVDFNQKTQAPAGFNGKVIRIIDHHALQEAAITTQMPIDIEIKPWGSTCTIIAKNYFFNQGRIVPKKIAGLLMAAILSDTINLRSPTTTTHDHEMLSYLAKAAGVNDIDAFAKKMFRIKSDISNKTAEQIINLDLKDFELGAKKVGIGVIETLYPNDVLERKEELIKAAKEIKTHKGYDLLFFFVVNIDEQDSQLLVIGNEEKDLAEKAFNAKNQSKDELLYTGKRISRKLQIVPDLTKALVPR